MSSDFGSIGYARGLLHSRSLAGNSGNYCCFKIDTKCSPLPLIHSGRSHARKHQPGDDQHESKTVPAVPPQARVRCGGSPQTLQTKTSPADTIQNPRLTCTFRKRRAPTIDQRRWQRVKEIVEKAYRVEEKTIREVVDLLQERHSFPVTERQLTAQIKQWGFAKNVQPHEMRYIISKTRELEEQGKRLENIRVRGKNVSKANIDRFRKRHGGSFVDEPSGDIPHGVTFDIVVGLEGGSQDSMTTTPFENSSSDITPISSLGASPADHELLNDEFLQRAAERHSITLDTYPSHSLSAFKEPKDAQNFLRNRPSTIRRDPTWTPTMSIDPSMLFIHQQHGELDDLNNLGGNERESLLERELCMLRMTAGSRRVDIPTLDKLYKHAFDMNQLGRYDATEPLCRNLYDALRRSIKDPRRELMAMRLLGVVFENRLKIQDAHAMFRDAVELGSRARLSQDIEAYIPAKLLLASVLLKTPHWNEAGEHCDYVLERLERLPSSRFKNTLVQRTLKLLRDMHSLGNTLTDAHFDFVEATALEMVRFETSDRDIDYYRCLGELAYFYQLMGSTESSEKAIDAAYQAFTGVIGIKTANHRYSFRFGELLSSILQQQGHLAAAQYQASQAAAGATELFGEDSFQVCLFEERLASVYESRDSLSKALSIRKSIHEKAIRCLYPEDEGRLAASENLANLQQKAGYTSEAETLFRETLQIRKQVYGTNHPRTVAVQEKLARLSIS